MKLLIKNISEINNYQKFLKKIKKDKIKKINKLQNNNKKKLSILGEMLFIEGIKRFYNIDYQNIIPLFALYSSIYPIKITMLYVYFQIKK